MVGTTKKISRPFTAYTLPETNSSPLKIGSAPKKRFHLPGYVSFREGISQILLTPWKTNMEPENKPLEKDNHLPNHHVQVSYVILVGGFNPIEKYYSSQIGLFPQMN